VAERFVAERFVVERFVVDRFVVERFVVERFVERFVTDRPWLPPLAGAVVRGSGLGRGAARLRAAGLPGR
jgi:hypothetical protein